MKQPARFARRVSSGVLVAGLGLSGCGQSPSALGSTSAGHEEPSPPSPPSIPNGARSARSSVMASGAPTQRVDLAELERTVGPRLSRSPQGLKGVPTPLGGTRIDLRGRFQNVSVARKNDDGTVETTCVTTPGELSEVVRRARQEASR